MNLGVKTYEHRIGTLHLPTKYTITFYDIISKILTRIILVVNINNKHDAYRYLYSRYIIQV